jgi:gluconolactonase
MAARTITDALRFPEGPIALASGGALVVEIAGKALTHVDPISDLKVIAHLEGGPNGAAVGPGNCVVIANSGGWLYTREANGWQRPTGQAEAPGWIELVELATGAVFRLYTQSADVPLQAPNDLVFDRSGNFYVTDHGKRTPTTLGLGAVHYGAPDGSFLRPVITGLVTPNGIGLSADERTLFVAETITRRLLAFDLTAPGEARAVPWPAPGGGRLVAGFEDRFFLDSLALDAEGHICVASFNGCGIWRVSPDGETRAFTPLDDFYATNIAFAGSTALVTLSSTGRLVALDWPCAGQPLAFEGTLQ